MLNYKKQFIEFCIKQNVIRFGEFKLKSGRISPYFFNAGLFNTGDSVMKLGEFYAAAIKNSGIDFDVLFGPAYKGIPIVVTTAIGLMRQYHLDKPFSFNRKTVKTRGEGGNIVGASLTGKVLMVDDVITAGTTVRETVEMIKQCDHAQLVGICIAFDRQERGEGNQFAIQEIAQKHHVKVINIIGLDDLIYYMQKITALKKYLKKIYLYKEEYGMI